jgi:putative acetyltransferase
MTDLFIRKETPLDYNNISIVNDQAFNKKNEGELVMNLRNRAGFLPELSLVADYKGKIIGHILFFPISILSGSESIPTLCLGPMAVLPGFQNKGIGGDLIREGLSAAAVMGFNSVLVLGFPKYYPKFGFARASKWKIKAPFEVPEEAMMAMELKKGSLGFGGGTIEFPQEYYAAL